MTTTQVHVSLICMGENHSVFLSNEGNVFVTGGNFQGQLGLMEKLIRIPKPIPNIPQITTISCGLNSTICIDIEGSLWGFGENTSGQLGLGDHNNINTPTKISNLPPIIDVKCGLRHTLCISEDSNLWGFGTNGYSQLFVPIEQSNQDKEIFPIKTTFSNIINIEAGNACSFAQNWDGEILVCGYNGDGQLGTGTHATVIIPKPIVNQPPNIVAMSCTYNSSLLLDGSGTIYGAGSCFSNSPIFKKIENLPSIISISCGRNCKCVDEEGNLWLLGKDYFNINNTVNNLEFTKSDHFSYVNHISYGTGFSDIIKDENGVFVCGYNACGQLGLGTSKNSSLTKWDDELSKMIGSKRKSVAKSARK